MTAAEQPTDAGRVREIVEDLRDHGLRFDLNPTMPMSGPVGYLDYIDRMDQHARSIGAELARLLAVSQPLAARVQELADEADREVRPLMRRNATDAYESYVRVADLRALLADVPAPTIEQERAEAMTRHRLDWASWIENHGLYVGTVPLTQEQIIDALRRDHPPFGVARSITTQEGERRG